MKNNASDCFVFCMAFLTDDLLRLGQVLGGPPQSWQAYSLLATSFHLGAPERRWIKKTLALFETCLASCRCEVTHLKSSASLVPLLQLLE